MKEKAPKGTFDLLPFGEKEPWKNIAYWQTVESLARTTAALYGYEEIRTPIFEAAALFHSAGDSSDIVTKEMYTFEDKSQRKLALRPEGTAAILRSLAENHLYSFRKTIKLFYLGPMFRYERPQKGRFRQHHQFGVEVLGSGCSEQDVEVMDLLMQFYQKVGLKGLKVDINTLGDEETRRSYRKAFIDFIQDKKNHLSQESLIRLEKNPLRILDSKDPQDKEILKQAPQITDYMTSLAREHFTKVQQHLTALHIPFSLNPTIVRGLDYYNHTVFEMSSNYLGSQNALGGGGRYDGFTQQFGAPSMPGIGFGCGLERVIQALLEQSSSPINQTALQVVGFAMDSSFSASMFYQISQLRRAGISAEMDFSSKKLHQALGLASSRGCGFFAILGEEEANKQCFRVKNLKNREEQLIPTKDFLSFFSNNEMSL